MGTGKDHRPRSRNKKFPMASDRSVGGLACANLLLAVTLFVGVFEGGAYAQLVPCPTGQKCALALELGGLEFLSQVDSRWADEHIGPQQQHLMFASGCFLAASAMIANFLGLTPRVVIAPIKEVLGSPTFDYAREISPLYMDFAIRDSLAYVDTDPSEDPVFDFENLTFREFFSFRNGQASSSNLVFNFFAWPTGRLSVDALLFADPPVPTILGLRDSDGSGHVVVVAGWDTLTESYLILDPAWNPDGFNRSLLFKARPMKDVFGAAWERLIEGVLIPSITGVGGLSL